ncbi:MAG: ATP-binding protein [Actinomycetota bacterium]
MSAEGAALVAAILVLAAALIVALAMVKTMGRRIRELEEDRSRAHRTAEDAAESSSIAAQEALRFGRILSAMPDGVLLFTDDRVRYANPAAITLLGGDPVRLLPHVRSAEGSFDIQVHHPVYRDIQCLVTDLDARTTLVVARDVTDSRRVDRMRQDFVANASHELKTPVATILAAAETLATAIQDDPETAERFTHALVREASRLSRMVQDLLDLARLDDPLPGDESADLSKATQDVVTRYRTLGRDRDLAVDPSIEHGLRVAHREHDVRVALSNLLDNAFRYTPSGGRITVRLRREGEVAVLEVADDGEGIPAKDLPRIFERFYRVDRARARETGGTGLGLAIVKHIAEQAGGTVSADSVLGEGATFTLRIPILPGT